MSLVVHTREGCINLVGLDLPGWSGQAGHQDRLWKGFRPHDKPGQYYAEASISTKDEVNGKVTIGHRAQMTSLIIEWAVHDDVFSGVLASGCLFPHRGGLWIPEGI